MSCKAISCTSNKDRLVVQDDAAITPVISESSANFIEGLVKDAEEKGATLCQKYKRENNLIWPVLLDHVTAVRPSSHPPFPPSLPTLPSHPPFIQTKVLL